MKLFEWLCGCDNAHRDFNDSAQYITSDCSNGIYLEKKPVICTEQPTPIEQKSPNKISNGYPVVQHAKPVNGFSQLPPQHNGHVNGKIPTSNGSATKTISSSSIPTDQESFSVPDFKLVENDVQSYKQLVAYVKSIISERQSQLEQLIERKQLPNEVDEDARAARGKIIVIVKNNVSTFEKLLQNATDERQAIADLTGFWGLVHKELLDVQKACERVETSRLNNWQYVPRTVTPPPQTPSTAVRSKTPLKSGQQTPNRTPKTNPNLRAFMAQKRKEMQSNEQLAT